MPDDAPQTLSERLNLSDLVSGLVGDLRLLREGKISVRDAHARAELARQILRGVHYVVSAQKYLDGTLLPPPAAAKPKATRGKGKVVDG